MTKEYEIFKYAVKVCPDENDVIDGDFPEYVEEYPALPEVKVDISFSVNRDEAYERNIAIYEEERRALLAEERERIESEERKLAEEKAALEQYYIDSGIRAAVLEAEKISNKNFFVNPANWLRGKAKYFAAAIGAICIAGAAITAAVGFGGGDAEYTAPQAAVKVLPVPFEEEGDTAVLNSSGLCWRVTLTDEYEGALEFKAEVINLSDDIYYFPCSGFYISDGTRRIYCSKPKSKERLLLRSAEWGDSESVTVYFDIDEDFKCIAFGYDESHEIGFTGYGEGTDASFEVSVKKLFN